MTNVSDHGIICLSDGDYAAVPLMLAANKATINQELTADAAALTSYSNPGLYLQTTTAVQGPFAANSGNALADGTNINFITFFTRVFPKGWYSVTATAQYQEVGAVTAGSYRRLGLFISFTNNFQDISGMFDSVVVATGAGVADSATVYGWFYSDGVTGRTVEMLFAHGNVASNMNVLAGARTTVQYLGSGAL